MSNEKIMSFSDLVKSKGYEIKPHIIGSEGYVVSKNNNHVKVDIKVILRAPFHHIIEDIEKEFKKLEENK
ncbi:hypothetical protein [Niallia taxi]|uniref:hypothetical protein n=1 Tax=Niallia taxi TaxID=2499688 RepID=UPI0030085017